MECRLFQSWPRFPPDSERNFPSKLPFSLLAPSCPVSTNHARSQRGDHDSVTHIRVSIAMEERGPRELKRGLRISWSIRTRNRYRVAQLSGSVTILIGSRYFVVWDRSWGKFAFQRKREDRRSRDFTATASIFHFRSRGPLVDLLSWTDRIMRSIRGKRIVYGGKATPQLDSQTRFRD